MRSISVLFALCLAFVVSWPRPPLADSTAIRVMPGDRLAVTVFSQTDLSGTFQVDGDGNIDLPLIGRVPVTQLTVKECETKIELRLADGYVLRPAVSVKFAEFRPVFIVGDVKTPGSFPFRFGASALSAIAQAGGYGVAEAAVTGAMADFLLADERVRILDMTKQTLGIRKARLEAQRDNLPSYQVPALPREYEKDRQIAVVVEAERELMESQIYNLEQEIDLFSKQKPRLEDAALAVAQQIEAEKRQFALVQSQLKDFEKLQSMGLARRTTEVALQREQATLDSNISRYRSEIARLTVSIGEIDIKIHDAKLAYNRRILGDLQDVRTKLQDTEILIPGAREVRELRLQQTGNATTADPMRPTHRIVINRIVDGRPMLIPSLETSILEPGDIVEVKRLRPQDQKETSSAPQNNGVTFNTGSQSGSAVLKTMRVTAH
jgi:polysaccharide export outer membrane protein